MVTQTVEDAGAVAEINRAARRGRRTRDIPAWAPGGARQFGISGVLPGTPLTTDNDQGVRRPPDLSFETLAEMATFPAIKLALNAVRSIVIAQFARATAKSADPARQALVQHALIDSGVLLRAVTTATHALQNGCAIHELVWRSEDLIVTYHENDQVTGEDVELTAFDGLALVLHEAREVNPATVTRFNREGGTRAQDGRYAGFRQEGIGIAEPIDVAAAESWVYSYDPLYGNMWGNPLIRDAWPYWRAAQPGLTQWAYWIERKADPTKIVGFPEGRYTDADGNEIDNSDIAIQTGNYAGTSTTVAIPSDPFPDSSTPRWSITDLKSTDKGGIFKDWLDYCAREAARVVLVPERVVFEAQGGGTNAESVTHTDTFLLTLDRTREDIATSVSVYLADRIALANLGPGDQVTIETPGLANSERDLLRQVLDALLTIPAGQDRIDVEAVLSMFGVPTQDPPEQPAAFGGLPDTAAVDPASGLPIDTSGTLPDAGAGIADQGPPDNLVLTEAEEDVIALMDAIALADVNLSRYQVRPDPKSVLGVAVIDTQTGHRLTGFAAKAVAKAFENQGKKSQRQAEAAAKKAQRQAESAQKKAATQAAAAQKKAAREATAAQKKADREATAAQKKADREAAQAQRKAESAAAKLTADQKTAARTERAELEKQTARLDPDLATQALKRKGWDAPSGDAQANKDDAIAEAEQVATDNPDLIVSVVKTGGGFLVITKPKDKIATRSSGAKNVALADAETGDGRPADDAPGYDSAEIDTAAESLIAAAARKMREFFTRG